MKLPTKTAVALLHLSHLKRNGSLSETDKSILSDGFAAMVDEYCCMSAKVKGQDQHVAHLRGLLGCVRNDLGDIVDSLRDLLRALDDATGPVLLSGHVGPHTQENIRT